MPQCVGPDNKILQMLGKKSYLNTLENIGWTLHERFRERIVLYVCERYYEEWDRIIWRSCQAYLLLNLT